MIVLLRIVFLRIVTKSIGNDVELFLRVHIEHSIYTSALVLMDWSSTSDSSKGSISSGQVTLDAKLSAIAT